MKKLFIALLLIFSPLSYADDCGGNNEKACHCEPEWYVGGLDCSPHDRCDIGCTQHGSSTIFFGDFYNEATCSCPAPPNIPWSTWTKTPIQGWAESWDVEHHLDQHMDWTKLNWVTELKPNMSQSVANGLYIYIFRTTDNKLLIRRSDRPDDIGIFAHGDKAQYSYKDNPSDPTEDPMFVRHTQLNGGWSPVWAAGQMEVYQGKVIWVSNASGHFQPQSFTLDYVETALNEWNVPTINPLQKLTYGWEKRWTRVPSSGTVIAVTVMKDGTILGVGADYQLYTRQTLSSDWVLVPKSGTVIAVTAMNNGTILGVGADYQLYTRQTLSSDWVLVPKSGTVIAVTVMKDGTILGIGLDNQLYTRQTLSSDWILVPKSGAVKAVTVMNNGTILGVGLDNQLYTRQTLSSNWVNIPDSEAVKGVTIINDTTVQDPNKVQRIIGIGIYNDLWVRLPETSKNFTGK